VRACAALRARRAAFENPRRPLVVVRLRAHRGPAPAAELLPREQL
jgi:hypothetical protein